jgi:hypothetical protein
LSFSLKTGFLQTCSPESTPGPGDSEQHQPEDWASAEPRDDEQSLCLPGHHPAGPLTHTSCHFVWLIYSVNDQTWWRPIQELLLGTEPDPKSLWVWLGDSVITENQGKKTEPDVYGPGLHSQKHRLSSQHPGVNCVTTPCLPGSPPAQLHTLPSFQTSSSLTCDGSSC